MRLALIALLALATPSILHADVKLPKVISSHMVLQRDRSVPIWGWAEAGEEITVEIAGQHFVTKANDKGTWRVELAPMKAGGPHTMTLRGKNRIVLRDILIGEVWVCSGQSNMEWRVRQSKDPRIERANAKFPKIRLFRVPRKATPVRQSDVSARWTHCTPETVYEFSAVGYYFGRELHAHLHEGLDRIPIGLIQSAWGGTRAEAWTDREDLARVAELSPILETWKERLAKLPKQRELFQRRLANWRGAVAAARKAGRPAPRRPRPPQSDKSQHRPANLFNGMIAPLIPYAIRGAIWYQGESNAGRAYQYRTLFPTMIDCWRRQWDQGDFPFLWVQLANWKSRMDKRAWGELREAQTMTLSKPNTGQAITIDIGNPRDIHPKNKQEVGRRLGLIARAQIYGEQVDFRGPTFGRLHCADGKATIDFANAEKLVVRGNRLLGFEIAGKDQKFYLADARIDGTSVIVTSKDVPSPVAVRYAFADSPSCNLFDENGLPAEPFRSDDWPAVTRNKKKP